MLLINLQVINFQYFSFLSIHSFGYELGKEFHLENQALITHFNINY